MTKLEEEAKRIKREEHTEAITLSPIASAKKLSKVSWPTQLRRRLAAVTGPTARADAEAVERQRWITELRRHIINARLLVVEVAEATQCSDAAWAGIGQRLRARTSRRRVRDWRQAAIIYPPGGRTGVASRGGACFGLLAGAFQL